MRRYRPLRLLLVLVMWMTGSTVATLAVDRDIAAAVVAEDAPLVEFVTAPGAPVSELVFRDSEHLIYVEETGPRLLALMELHLPTGTIARVHPDFANNQFGPACSPTGTHFAYIQNVGNLNLRLIIKNRADQSVAEFGEQGFSGMQAPCFTADGQRLLYSYPEDGRTHIWSCNLACEDRRREVDSSGINNWPDCGGDGSFVYSSTRDGNYEIYWQPAGAESPRRLTDNPYQDLRPAIAPGGDRIAFTSARDGNYELYLASTDGRRLQRLTTNPDRDDYAAWGPDGALYFVAEEDGQFRIARMTPALPVP